MSTAKPSSKRRLTATKQDQDALQSEILKPEHRGQAGAISSGVWAQRSIGLVEAKSAGHVKARAFQTSLIYERGLPLCSCSKGYFIPKTEGEMQAYLQRLMLRAQSIVERAQAVRRNFYHSTANQTTPLLEEAQP